MSKYSSIPSGRLIASACACESPTMPSRIGSDNAGRGAVVGTAVVGATEVLAAVLVVVAAVPAGTTVAGPVVRGGAGVVETGDGRVGARASWSSSNLASSVPAAASYASTLDA